MVGDMLRREFGQPHLAKADVLDHRVDRIEHRLRRAVAGVNRQIAEFERRIFAIPQHLGPCTDF